MCLRLVKLHISKLEYSCSLFFPVYLLEVINISPSSWNNGFTASCIQRSSYALFTRNDLNKKKLRVLTEKLLYLF